MYCLQTKPITVENEEIEKANATVEAFVVEYNRLSGEGAGSPLAKLQKKRLVADTARDLECTVGDLMTFLKEFVSSLKGKRPH